jgi:enoyl-CoA hydratase/carnithine racemase
VPIDWEREGVVGVAVIDRPERRNALNAQLCEELRAHLEDAHDVRAIVITGAGDKAFCAGADLGQRRDDQGGLEHGGTDTFRPSFEALLDAIVGHPAPVIAAVNGAALGAGMQLAVACDVRVVTPNAIFGIPSGRLGVMLSAANITRLVDAVGPTTARDVLLTARVLDVDEAERVGLVQRRADDALTAARELGVEIAALAPLSVSGHKRTLNAIADARRLGDEARREHDRREQTAFASDDLQEGLAAFAERRPPKFRGS